MINIETETLLVPTEAVKHPAYMVKGRPGHVSAVFRHMGQRGARAADGTRVKLESIRLPRGIVTSKEAIDRFIARLNGTEAAPPQSSQNAVDVAERELLDAGIH